MKKVFSFHLTAEQYGILLAVLIHIIIGKLFVFSFPVRDVAHKPLFIFLGSFLDPIDENLLPSQYRFDPDHIRLPNAAVSINPKQGPEKPLQTQQAEQKKALKTTFLQKDDDKSRVQITPDHALDTTKIKAQSLKLSPEIIW